MVSIRRRSAAIVAWFWVMGLVLGGGIVTAQTLKVALWQIPVGSIVPQDLIDKFEAAHPGVKVKLIVGSDTGYEERVVVMLASGTPLDFFAVPDWSVTDYREQGLIQPIDVRAMGFDSLDAVGALYFPEALAAFTAEDRLWALPQEWNTLLLYYNRQIFNEIGLPMPQVGAFTTADFVEAAQRATERSAEGDLKRIGFTLDWWHDSLTTIEGSAHIYSRRGELTTPMGQLSLRTPAAQDAYAFLQELVQERQIAFESRSPPRFQNSAAAMQFTGSWVAPVFQRAGIDFGLTPWPMGLRLVAPAYSWGWVISADSAAPELAAEFMRFVLIDRAERMPEHTGFQLPLVDSLRFPIYNKRPEMLQFLQAAPYGRYFPPTGNIKEVSTAIRQMVSSAVETGKGLIPFAQAVDEVEPRLRHIGEG